MRLRLRKEVYIVLAVLLALVLFFIFRPKRHSGVAPTNIDGLVMNTEGDFTIQFGKENKISLPNPPGIFLVVNGSVIRDSDIRAIEGFSMVPVDVLKIAFDGTLTQNDKSDQQYTLKVDKNAVFFTLGQENAQIDGKSVYLDAAPRKDGTKIYVPLKNFAEAFGYTVTYTDGMNPVEGAYPLIPCFQQIFLSKAPQNVTPLTKEQAIERVQEKLKTAYKVKFKEKFKGSDDPNYTSYNSDQKEYWQGFIQQGLKVAAENDRYYIVPVVWNFLVDKYTGDVYSFYQGETYRYQLFDPNNPGALAFPG